MQLQTKNIKEVLRQEKSFLLTYTYVFSCFLKKIDVSRLYSRVVYICLIRTRIILNLRLFCHSGCWDNVELDNRKHCESLKSCKVILPFLDVLSDFRSSLIFEFLFNKSFHDFSSLLFETVFYSEQSSIPDFW